MFATLTTLCFWCNFIT